MSAESSSPTKRLEILSRQMAATTAAGNSVWQDVPQAPPDPIIGITEAWKADPDPKKLNLGVGAYRTEEGKPLVLAAVKEAERRLLADPAQNKEYLPIGGMPEFCQLARELAFGTSSPAIVEKRVATVQAISGTGALRVGAEFLAKHYPVRIIYVPNPTWGNHNTIFGKAGLDVRSYKYYDPATRGLDYQGLLADLRTAPTGAVVLLHACAHNPTGVDPNMEQWRGILEVVKERALLPFFDSAYQGFASGDLDADAAALRMFASTGLDMLLAQSFAKNMGLYGERAGALSVVARAGSVPAVATRVFSQLLTVIRPMYSNPPKHGAAIAALVLSDPGLRAMWQAELTQMANRILQMRRVLYDALIKEKVPGSWTHITSQIGMFSYTGLNRKQCEELTSKWHVHLTLDGRISMAGLSMPGCARLAAGIADVVTRVG